MSSRQRERDEFIAHLTREFPDKPVHHVAALARALMRHGATLHRLAEAQCNGDWPADNGDKGLKPCRECESLWQPSVLKQRIFTKASGDLTVKRTWTGVCPDCRTAALVKGLCKAWNMTPTFGGDPRGCVLTVKVPSGAANNWERTGLCVP